MYADMDHKMKKSPIPHYKINGLDTLGKETSHGKNVFTLRHHTYIEDGGYDMFHEATDVEFYPPQPWYMKALADLIGNKSFLGLHVVDRVVCAPVIEEKSKQGETVYTIIAEKPNDIVSEKQLVFRL